MPRLTKRVVDALKPSDKPIWDTNPKGFGVRVSPKGAKTYVVTYRPKPGGRGAPKRWYTIGMHGSPWTVESARTEARRILGLVADGKDPQADRMEERRREGKTVAELIPVYIKTKQRQRSWKETERVLEKDVVPEFGNKRPVDVERKDIAALLDKVAQRGPVMAGRTFAHVRHFFRWCVERGHIETNPCRGIKSPEKPTDRERVLDDGELVEVWAASEAVGWPWEGMVKLLILTAQRRNEVTGMLWKEIEGDVWEIPASRTKNKRAHKVPLTGTALAVIEAQPKQETDKGEPAPVFSTNAKTPISGFSKAKRKIDKTIFEARRKSAEKAGSDPDKIKPMPNWTYHDLRRTATTGMARLGIHPHIADAVLNHKEGTIRGVAAVYNRHRYGGEARRALEAWEAHVIGVVSGKAPTTNVISMDRQQKRGVPGR